LISTLTVSDSGGVAPPAVFTSMKRFKPSPSSPMMSVSFLILPDQELSFSTVLMTVTGMRNSSRGHPGAARSHSGHRSVLGQVVPSQASSQGLPRGYPARQQSSFVHSS